MGPRLTPLFIVHVIVEISWIEYILIFLKKKNIYFKRIWNLLRHTLFYCLKQILIMNMPVFNFHKMADMHKGYAY
jgi:hypothetical protein